MKFWMKLIFALVVVPSVFGGLVYSLHERGFFNLSSLEISVLKADEHSSFYEPLAQKIEKALSQHKGSSLFQLDLTELKTQILKEPWVEQVHLTRRWPQSIQIQIQSKKIPFILIEKDRYARPVLEDGTLLERVPLERAPQAVVLVGPDFRDQLELRQKAVRVLSEVPKEAGVLTQSKISEVRFDTKDGFWLTLVGGGTQVRLGHEQFALRAARVSQVLNYLQDREMNARVIDADLSKKVVVRLRKGP
jgi:cell division protein FtsQ